METTIAGYISWRKKIQNILFLGGYITETKMETTMLYGVISLKENGNYHLKHVVELDFVNSLGLYYNKDYENLEETRI